MANRRYDAFRAALFPGDPRIDFVENPYDTPDEIFEEVARCTQIKQSWLQRSAREVLEGISGLGCLWFLHGASGKVEGAPTMPKWYGPILFYMGVVINHDPREVARGIDSARIKEVNWAKGTVAFRKEYRGGKIQIQNFKIGKFIDSFAQESLAFDAKTMHNELKWRSKANVYHWEVSCHPYDVLTMSAGRPWVSCMKPGGMFQYGPLTDMAAGSAILWYRHQGADSPCGRVILRPYLDERGRPAVATGGRLYGEGVGAGASLMTKLLGPFLNGLEVDAVNICPLGRAERALTRAIHSDTDMLASGCIQSADEYAAAYENLGDADWPTAKLSLRELAGAAMVYRKDFDWREWRDEDDDDDEGGNDADPFIMSIVEGETYFDEWWRELDLEQRLAATGLTESDDAAYEFAKEVLDQANLDVADVSDYVMADLIHAMHNYARRELAKVLSRFMVYYYSSSDDLPHDNDLATLSMAKPFLRIASMRALEDDYGMSRKMIERSLKLYWEGKDKGPFDHKWFYDDDKPVQVILLTLEDLEDVVPSDYFGNPVEVERFSADELELGEPGFGLLDAIESTLRERA